MTAKLNPKTNGSSTPHAAELRDIIPAFPEPQAYPSGWDLSGIVPPATPSNSVSKPKQAQP